MEPKTKIFAILAIFCLLCSACAVCAVEDAGLLSADESILINGDGHGDAIIHPDNSHDEAKHAAGMDPYVNETQDAQNSTVISPDAAHNQQAMVNQTNSTHAAGSGDVVNTTGNATGNSGAKNFLPATGNPVVILLGCLAVIGGVSVFRKK